MVRDWFPILDRLQEGRALLDELLSGDLQSVSSYLFPLVSRGEETTHIPSLKEGGEATYTTAFSKGDEVAPFKEISPASTVSEGEGSVCTPLEDWSGGVEAKVKH